jgi:hypothetical protein
MANFATKLQWIKSLLHEFGILGITPLLWCVNLGATYLTINLVFHARMKHMEIGFHFVHDMVVHKESRLN